MEKKFFAFGLGSNGGISTSCVSPPMKSLEEAREWATKILGKTSEVCVTEVVGYFRPVQPIVEFVPIVSAISGEKKQAVEDPPRKPLFSGY
jgi:hypothetical protein